jgi:hypothetical protein
MTEIIVQETLPLHAPGVIDSLEGLRLQTTEAQRQENKAAAAHGLKLSVLRKAVHTYNAERLASILREFAQRSLAWCTVCKQVRPQGEMQAVLSEGSYQESCGYEGGDYCTRTFSNLHNACGSCRGVLAGSHGKFVKAPYGGEFTSSRCYPVEERMGEYWVNRSGQKSLVRKHAWERPAKIPDTPADVYENLAIEWKLPPALEVQSHLCRLSHTVEEVVFKKRDY